MSAIHPQMCSQLPTKSGFHPLVQFGLLLFFSVLLVGSAPAQDSTQGAIRGQVKDLTGTPIPGATITVNNPAVGSTRSVRSDDEGQYRVTNLQPGDYGVTIESQGFSKTEFPKVSIAAGLTIALDTQMKVGATSDVVEVTSNLPMMEIEKPASIVNISGDLQRSLPLSARHDYSDFLEATPGVNSYVNPQSGGAIYSLRGSTIESHVTLLDSGDMTSFRQARPDYVALSSDALQDTQIKVGGGDATAPLGEGLVINVAAKDGTNKIHGAVSGFFAPLGLNWTNNPTGASNTSNLRQVDAAIGGPILKDRLWYFGAFRKASRDIGINRSTLQSTLGAALVPGYSAFPNTFRGTSYLGKLSYRITDKHFLSGYVQYDKYPTTANDATNTNSVQVQSYGGWGFSGRISSVWSRSFTTQIAASFNNKTLNSSISAYDGYTVAGPSRPVYTAATISSGLITGSGQQLTIGNIETGSVSPAQKFTISADANWIKSGWGGEHQFQFGVWLQPHESGTSTTYYSNGGNSLEDNLLKTTVVNGVTSYSLQPFHRRVYTSATLNTASVFGRDNAVYFQDVYRPIKRLTLTAGVRLDFVGYYDRIVQIQTQDSVEVGPRFGATYAITRDNNNILRFNWGRVAELVSSFSPPTLSTATQGRTDTYDNNLDGIFETTRTTVGVVGTRTDRTIDPNIHQPYVEDWAGGYRRQFKGQFSLDVSFNHRSYKDRPATVDTNETFNGNVFTGYQDVNFLEIYKVTNDQYNWYNYESVEVFATKQAHWGSLVGSYVRAFRQIEGTWQPHDPASFIQPSFFANTKCLGIPRTAATNSLSGTADTFGCTGWQDHTGRLAANFNMPYKLILSSSYTVQSGSYTGPVTTRIAAADPQFGPATVVLSNGKSVANPLATTVRFVGTDRGSAQVKAAARNEVDARVGRHWPLPKDMGIDTTIDFYNIMNGGAPERFTGTAANINTPANYLQAQNLQQPRNIQFQARFSF